MDTQVMDTQVILSIVAIAISTVLSAGAIWLSIWFYMESSKQNKETALLQTNIKNSISQLEQLYSRTYTDTFGALKTQLDAMQKHIFNSTVGEIGIGEPNNLRFSIIGCITQQPELTLDELCREVKGFKINEITEMVYAIHREGLIQFDGQKIQHSKAQNSDSNSEQGVGT